MNIRQIKIDFNVTETIKRYVYVYLLEGESCWLIDSGVAGSQQIILNELEKIGRKISDIKGVFLTHAHPDHIGSAKWIKDETNCKIYSSLGEEPWISDIDKQFRERPIPNFYNLAGASTSVDVIVKNGDMYKLEDGVYLQVVSTPGHSIDEVSYRVGESLFIGDSIPVKGDIPIYVDMDKTLATFNILGEMDGIEKFYPAWDCTYNTIEMKEKLEDARRIVANIDNIVSRINPDEFEGIKEIAEEVSQQMGAPMLMNNPLFVRTVQSHIQ